MKKIISVSFLIIILAVSLAVCSSAIDIYEAFTKETFESDGTTLPYRLYVPEDFDEAKKYPLVLFLHGAGERGDDNEAQLKNAVQVLFDREDKLIHDAVVIVPQCPEGNQWVDTPWEEGNYSIREVPESNELAAAAALVDFVAKEYSCDPARFYVMGLSMGGFGAWDLMMRHEGLFAAGIPICGGADPDMAEIFTKTPVFTFHGTADETVPYEGTTEMVDAIEDLGSRIVNFISYKGDGHGIWNRAASEEGLMEWLFAQKLESEDDPADTETTAVTDDTSAPEDSTSAPAETDPPKPEETSGETTQATESGEPDDPDDADGSKFPMGAIIAIASAVVIATAAALIVILKKKK